MLTVITDCMVCARPTLSFSLSGRKKLDLHFLFCVSARWWWRWLWLEKVEQGSSCHVFYSHRKNVAFEKMRKKGVCMASYSNEKIGGTWMSNHLCNAFDMDATKHLRTTNIIKKFRKINLIRWKCRQEAKRPLWLFAMNLIVAWNVCLLPKNFNDDQTKFSRRLWRGFQIPALENDYIFSPFFQRNIRLILFFSHFDVLIPLATTN